MNQDNEKYSCQTKNPLLKDFLYKVFSFNQKHSMRALNEKFKNFKLSHEVEVKTLPTPEEVNFVIEANFSKKIAKSKGWRSPKKTILIWIIFYYIQLMDLKNEGANMEEKNWQDISKIIGIFTPLKCKYMFSALKKSNVQQNDWSISEDKTLIQIILSNQYGQNGKFKWTKIAETLNHKIGKEGGFRLAKHCRERFYNHLNPTLKKGEWTLSDDVLLLQSYLKHHKKWSLINAKLQGKNDNIVKNRFYKLMKMNKLMTKNRKGFNDEKILSLLEKMKGSKHQDLEMNKFNLRNEKAERCVSLSKLQTKANPSPILSEQPKQISFESFSNGKIETGQNTPELNECFQKKNKYFHDPGLKIPIQMDHILNTDDELNSLMSPLARPRDESLADLDKIINEIESINIYEQKNFKFAEMSGFYGDWAEIKFIAKTINHKTSIKISNSLEMNLGYSLKASFPIELFDPFKKSIETLYGPSSFPPVSGFFTNLSKMRAELDYSKYQKMISADSRLGEELEGKIMKYLSYALILDGKFKFEPNFPKSIFLPFNWTDSFDPNHKIQLSSMKFEIVCHLYNVAITELIIGSALMSMQDDSDKKHALRRFRLGIWAVKEIKTILPSIAFSSLPGSPSFSDLSLQNLNVLESIFLGFSYFSLFEIHEKNEITLGFNNIAAIIFTTAKNFKLAKSIIEQNKSLFPGDLGKRLLSTLFFYEAYSEGIACMKMAKNHETLIHEQPNGQHMGFGVSYAKKGSQVLETVLKNSADFALIPNNLQLKLRNLADSLRQLVKIYENKNNQIYHNKEFAIHELPGAPEISQKLIIGPVIPEIFQKPISEESLFSGFMSEELEKELQDIRSLIEEFKNNVKNQVTQFKDLTNERFSKNSINFITNFSQSQMNQKEIPASLKQKFNEFQSKGGAAKLKASHKALIEKCLKCGDIVSVIRKKLENEAKEEKKYKDQYQHLWTTTSSEVLNYEYYQCLNDLLGKFNQAQRIDEQIFIKFQKNKEKIEIFNQGEEGILKIIPSSVDFSFFQNNNQAIIGLKEKVENVEKIIQKNDKLWSEFTYTLEGMNVNQKILEAKQKSAIPNQVAQIVLTPIQPLSAEINENIRNATMLVEAIVSESSALRSKMISSSVNAKVLEEINLSLTEVSQILDDMSGGGVFYENLLSYLDCLGQTVDDYVMARQAQFMDLIEKIDRMIPKKPPTIYQPREKPQIPSWYEPEEKKKEIEIEEQETKSFFDEETNKFPMGCSVFLPKKKVNNVNESQSANVFESTVVQNLSDSQDRKY